MSKNELAICAKLLEAHDTNVAGLELKSVCDFSSCRKFAVGSNCNASKYYHEAVSDQIMKVKEKDVRALNYSEDEINCAIRVSNGGSNHAEGFSQSQHNWDELEDYSGIALNINKWEMRWSIQLQQKGHQPMLRHSHTSKISRRLLRD
jgi:hypothetical protein